MAAFLKKFIILSVIAIVAAEVVTLVVNHTPFSILWLLLSIPSAFVGYLVGWVFRWILIHILHATTSSLPDKLFSIILPLLASFIAAYVLPGIFIK